MELNTYDSPSGFWIFFLFILFLLFLSELEIEFVFSICVVAFRRTVMENVHKWNYRFINIQSRRFWGYHKKKKTKKIVQQFHKSMRCDATELDGKLNMQIPLANKNHSKRWSINSISPVDSCVQAGERELKHRLALLIAPPFIWISSFLNCEWRQEVCACASESWKNKKKPTRPGNR